MVAITLGATVSLVRVQNFDEQIGKSVSQALELIDFNHKKTVESVAIKPNLCYYWDAATGYTTDPRIVAGIINVVRERYGVDVDIKIVESDATAMRTKYAFPALGYEKLAEEKDVELFNLSKDRVDEKKIEVNGKKITFKVPQLLMKSDLFINVPKLKTMRATGITCALKNIFGCIASPRKIVYHKFLEEAIVGINKILHPHLTIVDGLVVSGRHPDKLGLLMASIDPFSIDWVAAQIMGFNPNKLGFLRIAIKEGLGTVDGVETRGEDIKPFREVFPKVGFFSSKLWTVEVFLLKLYTRIVKDVTPPALEQI